MELWVKPHALNPVYMLYSIQHVYWYSVCAYYQGLTLGAVHGGGHAAPASRPNTPVHVVLHPILYA